MLKSYQAIYDHGTLQWIGNPPTVKRAHVVLVFDDSQDIAEYPRLSEVNKNGAKLLEIIKSAPVEVTQGIVEKFGDGAEWQCEQRHDRALPGREVD